MFNWLIELRNKPEAARRRAALVLALALTAFILILSVALSTLFAPRRAATNGGETSVLSGFGSTLRQFSGAAREQFRVIGSGVTQLRTLVEVSAPEER